MERIPRTASSRKIYFHNNFERKVESGYTMARSNIQVHIHLRIHIYKYTFTHAFHNLHLCLYTFIHVLNTMDSSRLFCFANMFKQSYTTQLKNFKSMNFCRGQLLLPPCVTTLDTFHHRFCSPNCLVKHHKKSPSNVIDRITFKNKFHAD